jgi:hypothetical protein
VHRLLLLTFLRSAKLRKTIHLLVLVFGFTFANLCRLEGILQLGDPVLVEGGASIEHYPLSTTKGGTPRVS